MSFAAYFLSVCAHASVMKLTLISSFSVTIHEWYSLMMFLWSSSLRISTSASKRCFSSRGKPFTFTWFHATSMPSSSSNAMYTFLYVPRPSSFVVCGEGENETRQRGARRARGERDRRVALARGNRTRRRARGRHRGAAFSSAAAKRAAAWRFSRRKKHGRPRSHPSKSARGVPLHELGLLLLLLAVARVTIAAVAALQRLRRDVGLRLIVRPLAGSSSHGKCVLVSRKSSRARGSFGRRYQRYRTVVTRGVGGRHVANAAVLGLSRCFTSCRRDPTSGCLDDRRRRR